ncbi:M16 family metallopeptidase [Zunongwangia atlantica]|uniref:Peptidase M16 n=1 Tax=Zunongwangia atlantica 22II14-10F7 TaxID=1185767 RepID=A0A1Y1T5X4_9FLAO|nr:insulinase family protein [Zunongwangia atlantica]ORL46132.1 peptidase M16 [Zunongwangia atlantica 22II14-10F7]
MKIHTYLWFVICLLSIQSSYSQVIENIKRDSLQLDTSIHYNVLDNGFSYYLKPLNNVDSGLKLRFIVKVGWKDEKPDETNFAHAIEHLAFRATENFDEGIKSNYKLLKSIEIDANAIGANTNTIWTSYNFDTQADQKEAITTAFLWFKDIADGLMISKRTVEQERGVLIQEYRGGDGNRTNYMNEKSLSHQLFPCHPNLKNFLKHMNQFSSDDLKQFYHEWYRPDQMSIIITGNFEDIDQIEREIISVFSPLKNPDNRLNSHNCDSEYYANSSKFVAVETSFKDSISKVLGNPITMNFFYQNPLSTVELNPQEKFFNAIKDDLFARLLRDRLKNNSRTNNKYSAHFNLSRKVDRNAGLFRLSINSEYDHFQNALKETFSLVNQLHLHGVVKEELELIKKEMLDQLPNGLKDSKDYWLEQIQKYALKDEILPPKKIELTRRYIKDLSAKELNNRIRQTLSLGPKDIALVLPADYNMEIFNEKNLRNIINNSSDKNIGKYKMEAENLSLMSSDEINSFISKGYTKLNSNAEKVIRYRLNNGLKLTFMPSPTEKENGKIFFHGFSKKGAEYFKEQHYYSAVYAPFLIRESGIGSLNNVNLARFFESTESMYLGISPYINLKNSGIKGKVSKAEFEKLLQLIYLFFNKPNQAIIGFDNWKRNQLKYLNRSKNGINDLLDAMANLTEDYSALPYGVEKINTMHKVNPDQSFHIYKEIFGNAEDFEFIFTGDFEIESILPLLDKYLGNLSNLQQSGSAKNTCPTFIPELPEAPLFERIDLPDSYSTENVYYNLKYIRQKDQNNNWKEKLRIQILGKIINRILNDLRTKNKLSLYFYGVAGGYNELMDRYEINLRLVCEPKELDFILQRVKEIISDIKKGNISSDIFELIKNQFREKYSSNILNHPKSELENLFLKNLNDQQIIIAEEVQKFINSLCIEDLTKTANQYLEEESKYELLMAQK